MRVRYTASRECGLVAAAKSDSTTEIAQVGTDAMSWRFAQVESDSESDDAEYESDDAPEEEEDV